MVTRNKNLYICIGLVTKGEKIDAWEYAYDLLNQLEQVKKNGEVVSSYIYDPNGFRVEKVGSKGKIHYVPLLNGEVGYKKEFSSNKEYSFIYVGIQHLARVNGVIGGSGKKFYYHNDHLGSALAVTDEFGNKVVERDFTPFGERINTDVYDDEPRDPDEDESGFTGKDFDEDIGLYYYNARWYDAENGRFTTEDSIADDPNLYSYCGQNPVNFTDPTGHAAEGAFKISFQKDWGLVGASLNAAALLTGNENLSTLSSVFSLFVAIKGYIEKVQLTEAIYSAAASSASGDGENLANSDKNDNLKGLNIKITAEEANSSDLKKYVNDLEASGEKDPETQAKIKHAKAIIQIKENLNSYTKDELGYEVKEDSGSYYLEVQIAEYASAYKAGDGTELLRGIINDKSHGTLISYSEGQARAEANSPNKAHLIFNEVNFKRNTGSNVTIYIDPYYRLNTYFMNKDGGKIWGAKVNSGLILGHELIHAYHFMNGVGIPNRFRVYGRINGKVTTLVQESAGVLSSQEDFQWAEELVTIGGFDQFDHRPLAQFIRGNPEYYSTTENTLRQHILKAPPYNRVSHAGY